jgi:1-acyl-sn-glycerol-3-phosphate acyltransferase
MKKLLYWIPTSIFLLNFGLLLVVFHILQVIAYNVFGYTAHKKTVDSLMWWLNRNLIFVGSLVKIDNLAGNLPTDKPMIVVSNHHSVFDITTIGYALRKHHPKYISKNSLGKGIPSISYNLRKGGSVLIDRDNPKEAIRVIGAFCEYLNEKKYAGVIFPEGTRSRDGKVLPFKAMGLVKMLREMPDATVVPVALENFWHIEEFRWKPVPFGYPLRCTILPAIDRSAFSDKEIVKKVEELIKEKAESRLEKI